MKAVGVEFISGDKWGGLVEWQEKNSTLSIASCDPHTTVSGNILGMARDFESQYESANLFLKGLIGCKILR